MCSRGECPGTASIGGCNSISGACKLEVEYRQANWGRGIRSRRQKGRSEPLPVEVAAWVLHRPKGPEQLLADRVEHFLG
jgi:hypothetical protein